MTEQEMFDCFGIHSRAWAASVAVPRPELPGWQRRSWVHREAAMLCAEALRAPREQRATVRDRSGVK